MQCKALCNKVLSVCGIGEFLRIRVHERGIGPTPDASISIGTSLIEIISPFLTANLVPIVNFVNIVSV